MGTLPLGIALLKEENAKHQRGDDPSQEGIALGEANAVGAR